jgi:hypothetical protein
MRPVPNVHFSILTSTNDVFSSVAECCVYLTARIHVSLKLDFQTFVSKIVHSDTRIVRGDQEFDFSMCLRPHRDRFNPRNLAPFRVAPSRTSDVNLGVIPKAVGLVK